MNHNMMERRVATASGLTVVQDPTTPANGLRLNGYAVVWDALSANLGGFKERIRKGAFEASLQRDDQRALFCHESAYVLGRKSASTLTLKEDAKGLFFSILPPDTGWARDLLVSIPRRDISQCSFGFTVDPNGDTWSRQGSMAIREVLKATLAEISIVSFPAYEATSVFVRTPMSAEVAADLARRRLRLQQLEVRP